jgi:hypothetical protein
MSCSLTKLYERYPQLARPCTITTDDKLWCVTGHAPDAGGVLAWCYDADDAARIKEIVQDSGLFSCVESKKYNPN